MGSRKASRKASAGRVDPELRNAALAIAVEREAVEVKRLRDSLPIKYMEVVAAENEASQREIVVESLEEKLERAQKTIEEARTWMNYLTQSLGITPDFAGLTIDEVQHEREVYLRVLQLIQAAIDSVIFEDEMDLDA